MAYLQSWPAPNRECVENFEIKKKQNKQQQKNEIQYVRA